MGFIRNNDNNKIYSKTRISVIILRLIECRKYISIAGEKVTNALPHLYFNAFISILWIVIRSGDGNHYENCVGLFCYAKKYFWIIIIIIVFCLVVIVQVFESFARDDRVCSKFGILLPSHNNKINR